MIGASLTMGDDTTRDYVAFLGIGDIFQQIKMLA